MHEGSLLLRADTIILGTNNSRLLVDDLVLKLEKVMEDTVAQEKQIRYFQEQDMKMQSVVANIGVQISKLQSKM